MGKMKETTMETKPDGTVWISNGTGATAVYTDLSKEALRHNVGKVPLSLLSPVALAGTARVLAFGAKKYSAHNWRNGEGLDTEEIIDSALRHLFLALAGEDLDAESGLPHIDHVAANIMFLQEQFHTGRGRDKRFIDERTLMALKMLLTPMTTDKLGAAYEDT